MPMLVLAIAEDLDELLEYGCSAAVAALGEFCGVVIMAVYISFVFVIAVLSAEYGRTYRAGEMLYMVFAIQGGDV